MKSLSCLLTGTFTLLGQLCFAQSASNVDNGGLGFRLSETRALADCADVNNLPGISAVTPNIIHYVRWTSPSTYAERWIVRGTNTGAASSKRVFGSREIRVLAIHYNVTPEVDFVYKVEIKEKLPSWLQNLQAVVGLTPTTVCKLGYLDLQEVPVPSDITVTGKRSSPTIAIAPVAPPPPVAPVPAGGLPANPLPVNSGATVANDELVLTQTFDNEGKYWADFSFGLPALNKKVTDFELVDGTLRRKEGSRAAAHGFLNVFPGRRDTKSTGVQLPHLMIGLPLTGHALDNPVVATGMSIAKFGVKFDVYAGCAFNRTEVAKSGGAGTDVRWVRKLTVGLNIPVAQFVSAYLKKK